MSSTTIAQSRFFAQYYELTLRVRLQKGKWTVVVLGPNGLLISPETKFDSYTEAQQAAVGLAEVNQREKHETRPVLSSLTWESA